jgi:hypothetical protein
VSFVELEPCQTRPKGLFDSTLELQK